MSTQALLHLGGISAGLLCAPRAPRCDRPGQCGVPGAAASPTTALWQSRGRALQRPQQSPFSGAGGGSDHHLTEVTVSVLPLGWFSRTRSGSVSLCHSLPTELVPHVCSPTNPPHPQGGPACPPQPCPTRDVPCIQSGHVLHTTGPPCPPQPCPAQDMSPVPSLAMSRVQRVPCAHPSRAPRRLGAPRAVQPQQSRCPECPVPRGSRCRPALPPLRAHRPGEAPLFLTAASAWFEL